MYFAVLYYCDSVGKIVLEIPEYGYATGSIVFTSSGSSGILILMTAFWGSNTITFTGTKWVMVLIFAICVVILRKTKMNPIWVMVLAGVIKVFVSLV